MTPDELDAAVRAVSRRQPFRPYMIEFRSGDRVSVSHPEAVYRRGDFHLIYLPDGSRRLLVAASVSQFILPT